MSEPDEHTHYSQRAPWLRAAVLGANDGLTSTAGLLMGFGAAGVNTRTLLLAGVSGLVSGALSMCIGELVSVWSARDSERADIAKEIAMQNSGPEARAHELCELTQIYVDRGLTHDLAQSVAEQLTEKDVIKAHCRDELGLDIDNLANPYTAALASGTSFALAGSIPFLAGVFVESYSARLISIVCSTAGGLAIFGAAGAVLGGANVVIGSLRVLAGGAVAMSITFGVGRVLSY